MLLLGSNAAGVIGNTKIIARKNNFQKLSLFSFSDKAFNNIPSRNNALASPIYYRAFNNIPSRNNALATFYNILSTIGHPTPLEQKKFVFEFRIAKNYRVKSLIPRNSLSVGVFCSIPKIHLTGSNTLVP
jgi:hypothetical protein